MRRLALVLVAVLAGILVAPPAQAVHWYRGPFGGCTPNDGPLTDPGGSTGTVAADVILLHNSFNNASNGAAVTEINVGEAVRWTWNSSHCHSVAADNANPGPAGHTFYSGFHYPTAAPESPAVLPGLFHYPVPDLTPTLSYTRTFNDPGTYVYFCEHHALIGMVGAVVVT